MIGCHIGEILTQSDDVTVLCHRHQDTWCKLVVMVMWRDDSSRFLHNDTGTNLIQLSAHSTTTLQLLANQLLHSYYLTNYFLQVSFNMSAVLHAKCQHRCEKMSFLQVFPQMSVRLHARCPHECRGMSYRIGFRLQRTKLTINPTYNQFRSTTNQFVGPGVKYIKPASQ